MGKIKGFIGETIVYGFGSIFSRLFAMFLIPLYAQYLGKIDYSNLIMLQAIFSLLTFFLALNSGVFFYYYEYEKEKYRKIVFTTWFYYQLIAAFVIVILLVFLSPSLVKFFIVTPENKHQIQTGLMLIGVLLFPYIFNITNINFFRIERKPKKAIVIVAMEAAITLGLVYLALAVFQKGLVWVLVSQITARVAVCIVFFNYAKLYIRIKFFSKKLLKKIVVYTWPFIVASIASWVIISFDKFIGAQMLVDKTDVALLTLAMQLVLPIAILEDMIRMAIGPFVMSIRKQTDAQESYQKIFELSVFTSIIVVIGILVISPFLVLLLTDESYIGVLKVIPLMGIANILLLASNQFCISFSLVKKNVFILAGLLIASCINIAGNMLFMKEFGFVVAGVSQIVGYLCMAIFLFYTGRKYAFQRIKVVNSIVLTIFVIAYVIYIYYYIDAISSGENKMFIFFGVLVMSLCALTYFFQQKITPKMLYNQILLLTKKKRNY